MYIVQERKAFYGCSLRTTRRRFLWAKIDSTGSWFKESDRTKPSWNIFSRAFRIHRRQKLK